MTVQYVSDLHIEFPENRDFLAQNPIKPVGDVLVLAGDIVPFVVMDKYSDFFKYLSDHFKITYWIPGNHEYYYSDLSDRYGSIYEKVFDNVFLVNNTAIQHENVNFIFSTLWSKISISNQLQIENGMSDFQVIKINGNRFTSFEYNALHNESLLFLEQALLQGNNIKTVVATHHVPTFINYPSKYENDLLNEAFAVELFSLIENSGPDFWIYGHSHANSPDFTIGKTQICTNQLGYIKYEEQIGFNTIKTFNI